MPTVSACMICQNEEGMVAYSLPSLLNTCDEVVIVDGGSIDGMERVIRETAEKCGSENKLKYFKNAFESLNAQRNFYLKRCNSDFIMYCDADEVITEDHIQKIKIHAESHDLVLVRSHHFYIDFWHIANGAGWENSYRMPRCFKNIPGILEMTPYKQHEGDHTLMVAGKNFMKFWGGDSVICDREDVVVHHYGHALGLPNELRRLRFFAMYDGKISEYEADLIARGSSYADKRIWAEGINADPVGIIQFIGKHPQIMESHPLYNTRIIKDN
jgi:glycosyltransferase involved in cell wall biosynthesis